eukprot:Rhum_TRINITY_DN10214_c0_g2::Rhum_TRINITY_DN10214_c0_g2_i1::g.37410::m.37410
MGERRFSCTLRETHLCGGGDQRQLRRQLRVLLLQQAPRVLLLQRRVVLTHQRREPLGVERRRQVRCGGGAQRGRRQLAPKGLHCLTVLLHQPFAELSLTVPDAFPRLERLPPLLQPQLPHRRPAQPGRVAHLQQRKRPVRHAAQRAVQVPREPVVAEHPVQAAQCVRGLDGDGRREDRRHQQQQFPRCVRVRQRPRHTQRLQQPQPRLVLCGADGQRRVEVQRQLRRRVPCAAAVVLGVGPRRDGRRSRARPAVRRLFLKLTLQGAYPLLQHRHHFCLPVGAASVRRGRCGCRVVGRRCTRLEERRPVAFDVLQKALGTHNLGQHTVLLLCLAELLLHVLSLGHPAFHKRKDPRDVAACEPCEGFFGIVVAASTSAQDFRHAAA